MVSITWYLGCLKGQLGVLVVTKRWDYMAVSGAPYITSPKYRVYMGLLLRGIRDISGYMGCLLKGYY